MRQVVVVVLLGIIKWMALFVQKATSQPSAQSESACSEAFSFSNLFECEPCFQTLVRLSLSLSVSLSRFRSLPLSILSLNFLGREMRCLVSEIQIQRSESDAGRERETGRAARTTTITSALASAGR